jgi:eukaryotic-like serine/threonine-protein kinase
MADPRTISHYEILEPLGKGGMGEVYLAVDNTLQRKVALKILPDAFASDQERVRRFAREARAASALNHPNVAQIYEVGESDGKHFLVMEYVDGVSLESLAKQRPDQPDEILKIAIELADALDDAHSKGIIHRDLKPSNVMLNKRGQIKILDFGLAKMFQQSADVGSLVETQSGTEKGIILGTVPYMSPEQAIGKQVDHRTDIFSYGTLLYTLLCGVQPFEASTRVESLTKVLHTNPEPLSRRNPRIDERLERIVVKCMEKDADSRYQSFREVLVDLNRLKRDAANQATAPSPSRLIRFGIPVVAIIALAALALILFKDRYVRVDRGPEQQRTSLAVLPFHIVTPEEQISYLSIGIPDAIITRLSNLEQIRLRPTSAILAFQNKDFDLKEVRSQLDVEHVVTGTIQKVGQQMRVRVQLIRARDGISLWGDTYDLSPSDLLTIEDSVSDQVSSALQIQIRPEQRMRMKHVSTQNAEAYELYLRGRDQLLRYKTEAVLNAIKHFEKALALDPSFAKARAGLAQAAADMHIRFASDDQVRYWGARALQEAEEALKMDSNLAEAHEARAAVHRKTEFEWDGTIEESDQALKLNSSLYLPHYYKAAAFYHLGLFDLAEQEVEKAMQVNASDRIESLRTQAVIDFFRGRYAETITQLEEVQRLTGKALAEWYLSQAYYYSGRTDQAKSVLYELTQTNYAGTAARAKASLAAILAKEGNSSEARKLLAETLKSSLLDHHTLYSIGLTYAQLEEEEEAVQWLAKSVEAGFPCYPWFQKDPLLAPIRDSASFQNLLSRLQQNFEQYRSRYGS